MLMVIKMSVTASRKNIIILEKLLISPIATKSELKLHKLEFGHATNLKESEYLILWFHAFCLLKQSTVLKKLLRPLGEMIKPLFLVISETF